MYKLEFDGESNLGYLFKVFEDQGDCYIFVGVVYSKSKNEDDALQQYLAEQD